MRHRRLCRLILEQLEPRIALNSYFVSPTGKDSNAGTTAAPWLTLQHAADQLVAGDIVTVEAGIYAGFSMGWNFRQNGTASAPIVWNAQSGVVINSKNPFTADGIDLEGSSFITLNGFDIENPSGGTISRAGIRAVWDQTTNAQGVILENNTINNCGTWGIFTSHEDGILVQNNTTSNSQAQHGIYVSNASVNPIVRGNTTFGNADAGIQLNGDLSQGGTGLITGALIVNNIIHDNGAGAGGSAINLDGVQNSIIENNLLYNNHSSGISLFMLDGAAGSKNNLVVNNTIVMASDARWALNIKDGSTGNTIFNNILYNANTSNGTIDATADSLPGLTSDYNVVVNRFTPDDSTVFTLSQWRTQTGQDMHSLISTPTALFVNAGANNYQLLATSPALDAGVSSLAGHNAPTVDIVGTARPQGTTWDIGTYELIQSAPGVATHFSISAPSTSTAGSAFSITVTALDAFNNTAPLYTGIIHFTSTDGAAVLPSDYLFTAGDAGVHTFAGGVTLETAGVKSVTATDTVTGSITGSASVTVSASSATHLLVTGFPSPTTAGVAHNFTVTALDQFNNTATAYTGTVTFGSIDGQAVLPANFTFSSGNAGVHTFSATLKTTGSQSITATDTVSGSITGSQSGITVNPAAASHFQVNGFTSPTIAGVAHNVTVTALDAFNNTATGYTGTVTFTSSDSQAALPANFTFAAGNAGVHTFPATLKTVGVQSITAKDAATSTITGAQTGITVNPAAATHLSVSGFLSPTTAGVAHNFTVRALDAFNNTATGYLGTVHFSSTDGAGVLSIDYLFVSGDAGVHTFSATLKTAGSQAITATDTTTSTIKGSQSAITVNPAAAASLVVAGFATPATAGTSHTFTVTAKDVFGNTASGYTGTVTFTSSDPKPVLPANYIFVSADAGTHTFSATLKTAGSQSITAADTVTGTIKGSQTGITVNPAAASRLIVSNFPSSTTAGVSQPLKVTAQDVFGNTATSYAGTIAFSSTDSKAVLPSSYTFIGADAGVHSFSATLKTAGSQAITATDTVTNTITGTESAITVHSAATSGLQISAPASVTAANAFTIVVRAVDPFGNTTANYAGTVHFTSSDNGATLPADFIFSGANAGVHTFTNGVTLIASGSQTVTATDTVTSSITGHATIQVNTTFAGLFGRVSSSGQWWVAASNGSSAFTDHLATTWNPNVTWVDVQTGDFNGDGKTDIIGRYLQTGQWWVSLNNGSTFTTTLWATWNPAVTWVDVKVGDFTGNSKAGIAGRDLQSGNWWVGSSTGSSFTTTQWAAWSPTVTWVDVNVGDFNGDGKSDLTGRVSQDGSWWTAISNGSSFSTSKWGSWNPAVNWVDTAVGDFNGDGKADIAARYSQTGQWWVALSTGSSFSTSLWMTWNPAVTWVDVKVGDFNGDGKTDIIGRYLQTGQWWASMSTGSGFTTSLWATWSPTVTWVDVQVGDFNGDGRDDITGRVQESGQIWTGLSNGSTAFNTSLWTTWASTVNWVDVHEADQTT